MKQINILSLLKKDINNLMEYKPGESSIELSERFGVPVEKLIKLNANENPYGPSPLAKKALREVFPQYYPSSDYKGLRKKIAKYNSAKSSQIVVGSGSDEIIDLLLRTILNKKDKVIIAPPTFGMYEVFTKLNGGEIIKVKRNQDYSLNVKKIKEKVKLAKIIFVCNPNNPTGVLTPLEEIEQLLQTQKIIIVDEAYFEFAKQTSLPLLRKYKNLIVIRTLSKWAGLAGLRIGYAVMDEVLSAKLRTIMPPFTVNVSAEKAAIATFQDLSFAKSAIEKIIKERERMYKIFSTMRKIQVYKSGGNYLFIKLENSNKYKKLREKFEKEKIALRYYNTNLTPLSIRITIGKTSQNNQILKTIKEVMTK